MKDAMPVLFDQNCLCTPYFLTILNKQCLLGPFYSREYDKLSNIVIHACKNITEKVWPANLA